MLAIEFGIFCVTCRFCNGVQPGFPTLVVDASELITCSDFDRRRQKQNKKSTGLGIQQASETANSQDTTLLHNGSLAPQSYAHPDWQPQAASLEHTTTHAPSTSSALRADSQHLSGKIDMLQDSSLCQNEGIADFEDAKPCDCGCVTQSVKAGMSVTPTL